MNKAGVERSAPALFFWFEGQVRHCPATTATTMSRPRRTERLSNRVFMPLAQQFPFLYPNSSERATSRG